MITLQQEADVNRVLLKHRIPVPVVHGMIDDPPAIVMDRLPGRVNLATALDDAERDTILDQYIEAMCRMHAIDIDEFAALGLPIPADNRAAALNMYKTGEANYREAKSAPSPMIEFMWRWLRQNMPTGRDRTAFIQADSAQFLYENRRLTGLIDFEAAYVGDPVANSRRCAAETVRSRWGHRSDSPQIRSGDRRSDRQERCRVPHGGLVADDAIPVGGLGPPPCAGGQLAGVLHLARWLRTLGARGRLPKWSEHALETLDKPDEGPSASYWHASYSNLMSMLDEWPAGSELTISAPMAHTPSPALLSTCTSLAASWNRRRCKISEIVGKRQPDLTAAEASWKSSCSPRPPIAMPPWSSTSTDGPSASNFSSKAPVPAMRSSSISAHNRSTEPPGRAAVAEAFRVLPTRPT